MEMLNTYFIFALIITFLFIGCLIYKTMIAFSQRKCLKEGFGETNKKECHNMLIEKDGKIYLYNSRLPNDPGVNPIQFDNLDEYTEFLKAFCNGYIKDDPIIFTLDEVGTFTAIKIYSHLSIHI
jgi:Ni,Fe-hydrogenase I cytochrome b subunit